MQLLFSRSSENGMHDGLNLIAGEVKLFPNRVKVPHIGWNQIEIRHQSKILNIGRRQKFRLFCPFVLCRAEEQVTLTTPITVFISLPVVQKESIFGIQFHPEKSQIAGLQMLKNFSDL